MKSAALLLVVAGLLLTGATFTDPQVGALWSTAGKVSIGGTAVPLTRLKVMGDPSTRIQIDGTTTSAGIYLTLGNVDAGTIRADLTGIGIFPPGTGTPSLLIRRDGKVQVMTALVDAAGNPIIGAVGPTGPAGPPGPVGLSPCTSDPLVVGGWICPTLKVQGDLHVTGEATVDGNLAAKYQ